MDLAELTFASVVNAYFLCRQKKRNKVSQLAFEIDLERNLMDLYEDLRAGRYTIQPSTAFVVTYPTPREIWAANFRDRVVHHLVYHILRDRCEPHFIRDTYACIPGRGVHAAIKRAELFARRMTHSWRRPGYVLQCDIQSFFNTIDKTLLFAFLVPYCPEPWLYDLVHKIVFNDPREGVTICGNQRLFACVPRHKSLWHNTPDKGLPIGNLTSQFFANVYMNPLDQFIKHHLRCEYYIRYVDDLIFFHQDPQVLNAWYNSISTFMTEHLFLTLHPRKTRLGPIHQGFDFVGYVQKPGRRYPRRRTIKRAHHKITLWEKAANPLDPLALNALCQSLNSYLGLMRHGNARTQQKTLCRRLPGLFFDVAWDCHKVSSRIRTASDGSTLTERLMIPTPQAAYIPTF